MIENILECQYLSEDSEEKKNKAIEDYRFNIDLDAAFDDEDENLYFDEDDYDFESKEKLIEFIEVLVYQNGFSIDWIDDHRFNVYKDK